MEKINKEKLLIERMKELSGLIPEYEVYGKSILNEEERITQRILLEKKSDLKISKKAPKKWWNKMIAKIKKENPNYDKEKVIETVGRIWSDLSTSKKKSIRAREGKKFGKAPEKDK